MEDIVDTGKTIKYIKDILNNKKPKSVKVCTLFFKKDAYLYHNSPKYIGFSIKNKFIIGYGLDYNGKYRNLRNVYCLESD